MIERAKILATATLADALDDLGLPGIMSGIQRQSGAGRIVGFARTMLEKTAAYGAFPFEDFKVGVGFDAVSEGEVLVVAMGGVDVSTFGGLASRVLTQRKAAGVVIDGGCRDLEEICASGLTVAAKYRTPRSGKGRAKVMSMDEPVTCGGVDVCVGDLVIIDDTGTVVLPKERAEEVLSKAEELHARDERFMERLDAGETFSQISASLRHA
ncbi:RraA family protein [Sneathiella aquimaris]|jgi:4-hydroxy-4-methyl-2-oxoglutarate aldolase|uniref:RraA family protein n=1 Tax=Sneathiella aquimaris TaxID=2599305 RepID=UPI00146E21AA|nr:RraA family protein [Sneathiella aquimaris]